MSALPSREVYNAPAGGSYRFTANSNAVELIALSTNGCRFDQSHVLLLFDTWCDLTRIRRDLAEKEVLRSGVKGLSRRSGPLRPDGLSATRSWRP